MNEDLVYGIDIKFINDAKANQEVVNQLGKAYDALQKRIDKLNTIDKNSRQWSKEYQKFGGEVKKLEDKIKSLLEAQQKAAESQKKATQATREATRATEAETKAVEKNTKAKKENNKAEEEAEKNGKKTTSRMASIAKSWLAITALIPTFKQLFNIANFLADKITEVWTSSVDLIKEVNNARTLLNMSFSETKEFTDTVLKLSNTFNKAASEVANFMQTVSRLGVAKEYLEQVSSAALSLANLTGGDLNVAAQLLVTNMNAFNISMEKSTHVAGVFQHAVNRSALDMQKMNTIMSYAASAAESTNVSFEQSVAVMEHLANAGLSASQIGSSMRNIFMELVTEGQDLFDVLDKINKGFYSFNDLQEIIGKRPAGALAEMAKSLDDIKETFDEINSSANDPETLANWKKYTSFWSAVGNKWNQFKNWVAPAADTVMGTSSDRTATARSIGDNKATYQGYQIYLRENNLKDTEENLDAFINYFGGIKQEKLKYKDSTSSKLLSFKNYATGVRLENVEKARIAAIQDEIFKTIRNQWSSGQISPAAVVDYYYRLCTQYGVEPDQNKIESIRSSFSSYNTKDAARVQWDKLVAREKELKAQADSEYNIDTLVELKDIAMQKKSLEKWGFKDDLNKLKKDAGYTRLFDTALTGAKLDIRANRRVGTDVTDWRRGISDEINNTKGFDERNEKRAATLIEALALRQQLIEDLNNGRPNVIATSQRLLGIAQNDYSNAIGSADAKLKAGSINKDQYSQLVEKAREQLENDKKNAQDLERNFVQTINEQISVLDKFSDSLKEVLEKFEVTFSADQISDLRDKITDGMVELSKLESLKKGMTKGAFKQKRSQLKAGIDKEYDNLINKLLVNQLDTSNELSAEEARLALLKSDMWTDTDLRGMTIDEAITASTKKVSTLQGSYNNYGKQIRSARTAQADMNKTEGGGKQFDLEGMWVGFGGDAFNTALDSYKTFNDLLLQETLDRIDREVEAEQRKNDKLNKANDGLLSLGIINQQQYAEKKEQLEKDLYDKQNELAEKQFEQQKKAQKTQAALDFSKSLAQIAINVYQHYSKYGAGGLALAAPVFAAYTALSTAQYGVQIAAINKQKYIPQKYEQGGYVTGASHAQGGIPISVNGDIREMEGGEYIINKRATAKYLPLLNEINNTGKYANGGYVSAKYNGTTGSVMVKGDYADDTISRLANVLENMSSSPLRAYVAIGDVNNGQKTVQTNQKRGLL